MKKKIIFPLILLVILGVLVFLFVTFIGNPKVYLNNKKLKENILKLSVDSEDVELRDVIPFEFDTLYTFKPYTSKEDIETIIGFKSSSIKESTNEGMVQLLFIKDKKVVSSVCDYSVNLGYKIINFGNRAYPETIFSIYEENKIMILDANIIDKSAEEEVLEIDSKDESSNDIEKEIEDKKEEIKEDEEDESLIPTTKKIKSNTEDASLDEENDKKDIDDSKEDENIEDSSKVEIIDISNTEQEEDVSSTGTSEVNTTPEIIIITPENTSSTESIPSNFTGNVVSENVDAGVLHTYHILDDGTYMCDGVIYKYTLSFDNFENVDDHYQYLVLTNNKNLNSNTAYTGIVNGNYIENSILVEKKLI